MAAIVYYSDHKVVALSDFMFKRASNANANAQFWSTCR